MSNLFGCQSASLADLLSLRMHVRSISQTTNAYTLYRYTIIPLPYVFAVHPTPLSYFYRRSFLLLELFLGTLSALTEFVTTLPEPSTPTRQLPHYQYTLSLKEKLHHILHLPPELSSSATDIARLRLSAPLLAASACAGIRLLINTWLYLKGKMNLTDACVYSASFFFLFVSILARSYAKDLDRDIGELRKLKYANKGA